MRPLRLLPAKLRALVWGLRADRAACRHLSAHGLDGLELPRVPGLPYEAKSGVEVALRFGSRNCLAQSMVRQAWYAAHGKDVALIIGVTPPGEGFRAHAWLDIDPPLAGEKYAELTRRRGTVPGR